MYFDPTIARTQQALRLGEAERLRRGHYLARRKARRAERAALQARLMLDRSL